MGGLFQKVQELTFLLIAGKYIIAVITAIHNVVVGTGIRYSYSFHKVIIPHKFELLNAPPPFFQPGMREKKDRCQMGRLHHSSPDICFKHSEMEFLSKPFFICTILSSSKGKARSSAGSITITGIDLGIEAFRMLLIYSSLKA